ncbi:hypothetical protein E2C01_010646 [Portunus trituberculatus]|uniref:Uncharacterized protein n=1 Tax=Portunus trituberculatus TaxID=210409 RepID=A0A5B7D8Y9_PORTR|nr:hypothetical protein [Portunus trituberculatus]
MHPSSLIIPEDPGTRGAGGAPIHLRFRHCDTVLQNLCVTGIAFNRVLHFSSFHPPAFRKATRMFLAFPLTFSYAFFYIGSLCWAHSTTFHAILTRPMPDMLTPPYCGGN